MKLTVHERLSLVGLLPAKGDYATIKTIRRAREMISFTPDEMDFYGLKQVPGPGGQLQWNWDAQKAAKQIKDCPVDEYTTNIIRNKLAEMDKKGQLTEQYMSIYEKFVIDYR